MDFTNIYDKKKAYAKYMVKEIRHICTKFEKREPGTKGEQQACEYMAGVLKKLGCEAQVESFKEHPRSFFGWIFITITCVLLAVIALFVVFFSCIREKKIVSSQKLRHKALL